MLIISDLSCDASSDNLSTLACSRTFSCLTWVTIVLLRRSSRRTPTDEPILKPRWRNLVRYSKINIKMWELTLYERMVYAVRFLVALSQKTIFFVLSISLAAPLSENFWRKIFFRRSVKFLFAIYALQIYTNSVFWISFQKFRKAVVLCRCQISDKNGLLSKYKTWLRC